MPIFKKKEEPTGWKNTLNKALYSVRFFSQTPLNQPRNYKNDLIQGYLDNELIYSIVNKLSGKASSVPIILKDENDDIINKHWSLDFLEQPNPDMTFKELINAYYIYLLSLGNSYMYSPVLTSERRNELWIMPAEEIEIVMGQWYEPIKGYKLITGQQEIEFDRNEVLHSKLFNPRFAGGQWVYGLSPISVALEIIKGYNLGVERMQNSFINGGPEYAIFTKEGLLNGEQLKQMEETFNRKFTGSKNAKKMAFSSQPLDAVKLGSDPVDLSIIDNNIQCLRTLCNVYNVSSILFNDSANSTLDNYKQARLDMYNDAIIPLNTDLAQRLTKFLKLKNEGLHFEFDYSDVEVLQESLETRYKGLNDVNYLTSNEKREKIGYNPLEKEIQKDGKEQDN